MTRPRSLPVSLLRPGARLPTRAHPGDAGLDLYAAERVVLAPGQGTVVPTGVAAAVPDGCVGLIADRSSLAKRGLKTAGGVVDAGYRGEVGVVLWNLSAEAQVLEAGDRVAQMLILPIALPAPRAVRALPASRRGKKGFGSTGK